MNAHAATGIRELTAQELDHVTGGRMSEGGVVQNPGLAGFTLGWAIGLAGIAIGGLIEWLFG